jgi:hypothetical protein
MKSNKIVWISLAEVEAHEENCADMDRGEKAFVNVLVSADSKGSAELQMKQMFGL